MVEAAVTTTAVRNRRSVRNRVYDGIPEALDRVRDSGVSLFVASSKPTCFAERILEHYRLAQYIHAIYGSELDGTRSDERELIQHLLAADACLRPTRSWLEIGGMMS